MKKKISKLGKKIALRILFMLTVIMLLFSVVIINIISKDTRRNAINNMKTVAEDRRMIIENYIEEVERTLTAYSRAGEIRTLAKNPVDTEAVAAAQNYTERFSADIPNLEGIYFCDWDTFVLCHTNADAAGITMRKGESLQSLRDSILAARDGIYNAGIVISPASGSQVIAMYREIYDDKKNPVGIAGIAIYTEGIVDKLDGLPIQGRVCLIRCSRLLTIHISFIRIRIRS